MAFHRLPRAARDRGRAALTGPLHAAFRNNEDIKRAEEFLDIKWVGGDVNFDSFNKYRHYLQSGSIFFNPSHASPNPRARTEAMLTGLAIVTTNSHGGLRPATLRMA